MKVTLDGEINLDAVRIAPTRWNGFACPFFTREQAVEVVAHLNALYADAHVDERRVYKFDGDDVIEQIHPDAAPSLHEGDYEPGEIVDRWEPDADGLYSIGAFAWVWCVVDEDEDVAA